MVIMMVVVVVVVVAVVVVVVNETDHAYGNNVTRLAASAPIS